ncbi:hemerythrin domain-containing protein [Streptomyces sp. RS10V-4]|uniref:hemerythrin domain-containing protein n=1 Tax=Streptomyces rhizoryzae TaxID=2932493 RepID=UPI002003D3F4|nr:hemerythrin domain-containing protein [Streptomyces rhizoryzae]MCK7622390.1 hemerythrin domain-containing protein [Streptomyces rhizoryzae]
MTVHTTVGQDPDSNDVVILLEMQHREIRRRMDAVLTATGKAREKAFRRFVHLLAVHETAEEEILHPYVRKAAEKGGPTVAARLDEEEAAKRTLRELEDEGCDSEDFPRKFRALRDDVLAHAEAEEAEEFPLLRSVADAARLQYMSKALRAAETVAPTRPHPGTGSAAGNLLLGPFAAIADRTREAVRMALGR